MSAAEVIELIKKLPPAEQAEVVAFVKAGNLNETVVPGSKDEKFQRAAQRVFAENTELLRRLAE